MTAGGKMGSLVDVRLLYTAGCVGTPATVDLINSVAAEMGIQVRLERILVQSPEQANELRFLGSPTVQVNGLDIDPAARDNTNYGFT
jgi:hypothetical protein